MGHFMINEIDGGTIAFQLKDNQPLYLLLKSATSNFWGYPKGHVEGNETLQQAAQRELREETGIRADIDDGFHFKVEYDMKNGHHKEVTFFVTEVPVGTPVTKQDEEISEYRWCTYDEALKLVTYDNLLPPLKKANKYIEEHYVK